jgi:uncharacterized protein YegL
MYVQFSIVSCDDIPLTRQENSFSLFEDAAPINPNQESFLSISTTPGTSAFVTLLVLDLSNSVVTTALQSLISSVNYFIDNYPFLSTAISSNTLSIVGFAGDNRLYDISNGFSSDKVSIKAKAQSFFDNLDEMAYDRSSTNLYGTVIQAISYVESYTKQNLPFASKAIVFMSDGHDTSNLYYEDEALNAKVGISASFYAIGVGDELSLGKPFLNKLATPANVVTSSSTSELLNLFKAVVSILSRVSQTTYLLSYCSPSRASEKPDLNSHKLYLYWDRQKAMSGSVADKKLVYSLPFSSATFTHNPCTKENLQNPCPSEQLLQRNNDTFYCSASGLSVAAIVGISVGVSSGVVCCLFLIAGAFFFYCCIR